MANMETSAIMKTIAYHEPNKLLKTSNGLKLVSFLNDAPTTVAM